MKIVSRPPKKDRLPFSDEDVARATRLFQKIRKGKTKTLRSLAKKQGNEALEVPREHWPKAMARLSKPQFRALELACRQIGLRARKQLSSLKPFVFRPSPGWSVTQKLLPVHSTAVVLGPPPHPQAPLLLAAAIPAALAEVPVRAVCVPPSPDGLLNPLVVAAAHMAEATHLFMLAGPTALAALSQGIGPFPRVSHILASAEPGVPAMSRQIMSRCSTEVIVTGSSELMILAEGQARADLIAAELAAHLERNPHSTCGLVTTNQRLAREVRKRLRQAHSESDRDPGDAIYVVRAESRKRACSIANERVPDHLWLLSSQPEQWVADLTGYGALHVGPHAAEVLGEAGCSPSLAGPYGSHWRSMISALDFLKVATVERIVPETYRRLGRTAAVISEAEGRTHTADAARSRIELQS